VIGLNTVQVAGTTFTNIQAINAGAGDDTFTFSGDGKLDGLIDGGGGNNTLSYAGFTGDVVVNLRRHAATAVGGGIFNVANVTGGRRNSLLVGDGGVNILRGGGGRSILIGGLGNDALFGGAGDNILIGDATLYDDDATALQGIFNEWNRTDASFEQRVADLISAGRNGLNGAFTLDKKAVVTDNASDSLVGSAVTLDWFLADKNLDAESGVSAQDHITQV
jgi:Ca2+-binding RTX toxin-like protein